MQRAMPTLPMGHKLQERYHILHKLATGGFGAVYVAEDLRLRGRKVAVKELSDVTTASRDLFRQEARVLAGIDHPGLVHVSDFFEEGRSVYLVMDYIKGQDLLELAVEADEEQRMLPHEQVLRWMVQVCEAVAYLHRHAPPIIHRDIKPNNIRLDTSGRAILVDFGIAKVGAKSKTQAMAEAVSRGFSPPEQYISGLGTDTRSDVYALGATLYCLLTVSPPPDSLQRLTQQIPLPPVRKRNPKVAQEINEIINTAMALHADQRFDDAGDMLVAVQKALGVPVISLAPKPPPDSAPARPTPPPTPKPSSRPTPPPAKPICPRCGQPARNGARFCGKCGTSLQTGPHCPNCGASNRVGARFCAQCRARLASAYATPLPIPPDRHIQEGDRHRRAGRFQDAIHAYEAAVRLGTTDPSVYENLAQCYLEVGAYSRAISLLKPALRHYADNVTLHVQLGMAYLNIRKFQEALQALEHAHQLTPQDAELAELLARLYLDFGKHAQARPILERLVQKHPEKLEPRMKLAACYIMMGNLHNASSLVKALQRSHPESAEITFLRGMIDFKRGKLRRALRHFQGAVKQDPNHALAHYFIGEIYFRREQWQRALQAYQVSARANPKSADAPASICLCYLALGKQTEARNALREALRINPQNQLAQRIQRELKG